MPQGQKTVCFTASPRFFRTLAQGGIDMNEIEGTSAQRNDTEQQREIIQLNARLRQQFAEYDMLMESTGVCIVKVQMADGFPLE
jgi:hypothetical protein